MGIRKSPSLLKRKSEIFKLRGKKTSGNPSKRDWNYLSTFKEREWGRQVVNKCIFRVYYAFIAGYIITKKKLVFVCALGNWQPKEKGRLLRRYFELQMNLGIIEVCWHCEWNTSLEKTENISLGVYVLLRATDFHLPPPKKNLFLYIESQVKIKSYCWSVFRIEKNL